MLSCDNASKQPLCSADTRYLGYAKDDHDENDRDENDHAKEDLDEDEAGKRSK